MMKHFYNYGRGHVQMTPPPPTGAQGLSEWFHEDENNVNHMLRLSQSPERDFRSIIISSSIIIIKTLIYWKKGALKLFWWLVVSHHLTIIVQHTLSPVLISVYLFIHPSIHAYCYVSLHLHSLPSVIYFIYPSTHP